MQHSGTARSQTARPLRPCVSQSDQSHAAVPGGEADVLRGLPPAVLRSPPTAKDKAGLSAVSQPVADSRPGFADPRVGNLLSPGLVSRPGLAHSRWRRNARRGQLRDIDQPRSDFGTNGSQCVAQHAVAKRARSDNRAGSGGHQLTHPLVADPGALLFA